MGRPAGDDYTQHDAHTSAYVLTILQRISTMAQQIKVEGYDAFVAEVEKHKTKTVYALFSGSKSAEGKSWCPDCVTAEPVVYGGLSDAPEEAVFIYCGVGERAFWKDQQNIFRTDPKLKVKSVPTLMKLGTPMRLEEGQCAAKELVEELFTEEN